MMRWLLFLVLLCAVIAGGVWLFQNPGEVLVTWLGLEITLHIAVLIFTLVILTILVSFSSILVWRLLTWPTRRRLRRRQRTLKRGLEHLTRGVTALAMGEEDIAEEALKKARIALPGEPLPQLLTAQLLQRQGKHTDAQLEFRALMNHKSTAGLATRRLIEQHLGRHEWRDAIRLAEEARAVTPRDRWLAVTLIDLYAREKNTALMLSLTEGWQWQSPLTKEERHRYAALAHYLAAEAMDSPRKKEQALRHAVGYAPDFLPAVVNYAYVLLAENAPRRARKWLLSAWKSAPSSLLIPAILASIKDETPRAQSRLLKAFLPGELTATHHFLAARQAMATDEYARARSALEQALALEENKESLLLMADIERELHSDEAAHDWLSRASTAAEGARWVCLKCGHTQPSWQAHCGSCGSFDSLRYERPQARTLRMELAQTTSL